MDKIYAQNNYLVIEIDGLDYFFPQNASVFYVVNDLITISTTANVNIIRNITIDLIKVSDFYNESGTIAYTYDTLIELLTFYTSKM